jgi:hypothetical protein
LIERERRIELMKLKNGESDCDHGREVRGIRRLR